MKTRVQMADDGVPEGCDILANWNDNPLILMEEVDRVLKKHGLEVEELLTGSDCHMFNIIKKVKK